MFDKFLVKNNLLLGANSINNYWQPKAAMFFMGSAHTACILNVSSVTLELKKARMLIESLIKHGGVVYVLGEYGQIVQLSNYTHFAPSVVKMLYQLHHKRNSNNVRLQTPFNYLPAGFVSNLNEYAFWVKWSSKFNLPYLQLQLESNINPAVSIWIPLAFAQSSGLKWSFICWVVVLVQQSKFRLWQI